MKFLLNLLLCGLILTVFKPAVAASSRTATPAQQAAMKAELARLITQFGDGIAETYSGNPSVIKYGQLFDDNKNDAVVLFNLEGFGGSNHQAEFIAFFQEQAPADIAGKHSRPYRLVAVTKLGQRGWRAFDFASASIRQHAVTLKGVETGAGDALCCPSVEITRTFHIDEYGHIVETKAGADKRRADKQ
ncbi:hypothetical protein [Undibacterium pigrum]|uniref:Uncharacterized protein n=1 Tax=Undibacterium pigrum TaxID=401470 RepID=A0A318J7L7_9BURK|nr:hypothetical protein [Undibacterium pigrum]PXX43123.1 hypothetical protein DFR42_104124 [Undibacterium pigrum]